MPNKIQIKRTSVTGRTPNTTSSGNSSFIDTGELALNITDGKLFSSDGTNYIEVGANLNSLSVGGAKLTANATLVNAVALNVVNQTNTGTLFVTTSANIGGASVINSTALVHNGRITSNSGIKIGSSHTQYELSLEFNNDAAGTWRKIGAVSLATGTYSTAAFKIDIIDPNANHGTLSDSWKPDILSYFVACVRTNATVQDDPDACYVRGPANHIRAVKTSTGNYEIQIQNEAQFREYLIKIQCYVQNANDNGGITFFDGSTAGSAGTAQYNASVGASINFFESINIGNSSIRIFANATTINIGSSSLTNALANLQALNVVNQTNTATLYVTTSANVASAFLVNSTGAYHTGTINAASHTVGTTTVINSTAISLGPFGTTNGTLITTTSIDVGNTVANAALDYNIIYVANSSSRANLTPTTLAIGSITVNSALANLQALNVVNQTNTATLYVSSTANVGKLNVAAAGGDEGGEIFLDKPPNGTLSGGITIDAYQNRLRFFEQGGTNRGAYIDLASCGAGVSTNLLGSSSSVAGSDTQVQFNDSSAFGATAGFTFNKTTNNVTIGNTVTVGTTATVNGSLANLQALNVVNQTNTATLFVTTSANVGTNVQITTNSFRLGNASSNVNITNTSITHLSNNAFNPQVIVRNSNNDEFGPYWSTGKSRAGAAVQNNDDLGTFMFQGHDGTDFRNTAYIVAEVDGTVSTSNVPSKLLFFTTNTSGNLLNRLTLFSNGNADVNNGILTISGGPAVTSGSRFTNTTITVGNSTINTTANSTTILVNGVDLVATQKRAIAMSMIFGR